MQYKKSFLVITALTLLINAHAQTIRVAAAANLQSVINVLGSDFNKRTGITVESIVGASGKLVAQISNGAPFDIFLSADTDFPEQLFKNDITTGKPIIYALGSLIICSNQNVDLKNWKTLLESPNVDKIAIANAATAPYGRAAEETLQKLQLSEKLKQKMVYGESISQVNTYITTGTVTAGFTSLSLIKDPANPVKLNWQFIDPKYYAPIKQAMVQLKARPGVVYKPASRFYAYMQSAAAKNILKKYGYIVP